METKEDSKQKLVILKGINYLLWTRTLRTYLRGCGLWNHVVKQKYSTEEIEAKGDAELTPEEEKWYQDNNKALSIIQQSLDPRLLEGYSYCDTVKELWDSLQKMYGNLSNLSRVYEVKKAINDLAQEEMDFSEHFGRFKSLWAEYEMLRPSTKDPTVMLERREQDQVFGLLLTLNSSYKDVIKHILRAD